MRDHHPLQFLVATVRLWRAGVLTTDEAVAQVGAVLGVAPAETKARLKAERKMATTDVSPGRGRPKLATSHPDTAPSPPLQAPHSETGGATD